MWAGGAAALERLTATFYDEVRRDPILEFRSAFVAYIERGTRLALRNSQPGVEVPARTVPVPRWGWGEAPPYNPGT